MRSDGIENTLFYSSSVVISIIHVDQLEEGHCGLVPFGQPCTNCTTMQCCCIELNNGKQMALRSKDQSFISFWLSLPPHHCLPSKMVMCVVRWVESILIRKGLELRVTNVHLSSSPQNISLWKLVD